MDRLGLELNLIPTTKKTSQVELNKMRRDKIEKKMSRKTCYAGRFFDLVILSADSDLMTELTPNRQSSY